MSEDCQKCGTAMYDLDEYRNCPGCSDRLVDDRDARATSAGDVEVVGYRYRSLPDDWELMDESPFPDGRAFWQFGRETLEPVYSMDLVTRLTAERDGLKADLKAMGERYQRDLLLSRERWCYGNRADTKIVELQSELTKARELLSRLEQFGLRTKAQGIEVRGYLATPITHNADESCGQDAEAAKCARCEASTVESCDEKGCGYLGAGNGAPSSGTVNGLTDGEWQDRDDQDRQELELD